MGLPVRPLPLQKQAEPGLRKAAQRILDESIGRPSTFHEGQFEAIEALVAQGGRHLVVQRTGWGKSTVYFTAARLLRERGKGATVIISPLLSLTRDQIRNARQRFGLVVEALNSSTDGHDEILARWIEGAIDVLYITPERLARRQQFESILAAKGGIALFVVDEAHCISSWGHDFRPDFRRIVTFLDHLDTAVAVLCTTATASRRVVEDIRGQVGTVTELRGPLARSSLHVDILDLPSRAERMAWLARNISRLPGSGIIYCLTQRDTEVVADWLRSKEVLAAAYHGRCMPEDREGMEAALLENKLKALVATSALGMGFDKPDLGFVVHFQRPASVVDYYQQIGRAGRAIPEARCVLLCGAEDGEIHANLRRSSFPSIEHLRAIVMALEQDDALKLTQLRIRTDMPLQRLAHAIRHLEIDGAIEGFERDGEWLYHRTAKPWVPPVERMAEILTVREREWERLDGVVRGELCIMRGVAEALDDPHATDRCAQCSTCRPMAFEVTVPAHDVAEAQEYYNGRAIEIEPRKQWMEMDGARRAIPKARRCEIGRALSKYQDAGWGQLVRQGKYETYRFDDRLVDATRGLLRSHWPEAADVTHVAYVPSRSADAPIGDFARRLATRLGLPTLEAVRRNDTGRQQKSFETSEHQLAHARQAYDLIAPVPPGARILLVDDLVDSRWTFTVVGAKLLEAGAATVYPFALADAGHAE